MWFKSLIFTLSVPVEEMKPRLSSTTSWGSDSEGAGSLSRGSQIYFSTKARLSFRHQLDSNINAVDATDWAEQRSWTVSMFTSVWWRKGTSAACQSEMITTQVQQGRKSLKVTLKRVEALPWQPDERTGNRRVVYTVHYQLVHYLCCFFFNPQSFICDLMSSSDSESSKLTCINFLTSLF